MKCPNCGSPVSSDWRKCVICGSILKRKGANPKRVAYWLIFRRAPWSAQWVKEPVTRNYKRAEARRRFYELKGYETRPVMPVYEHSNPNQELKLVIRPMTWDAVAAWIEAEGSFYTRANRRLYTRIDITQKNRVLSGYKILEQIKNLVDTELGTKGEIYEYPERPPYLRWDTHIDCYKITARILPYMHHPAKIQGAINMLHTIETWKRRQIQQMRAEIPHLRGRALAVTLRNLEKEEKDLATIQSIKREYPYVKALY